MSRSTTLHILGLIVLNLATWGRTLTHGFVFDDLPNILQNEWIRSLAALPQAFSHHAAGFSPLFSTSFYRPFMHVLYACAFAVGGVQPWAYHAMNIVLAMLSAVCAYVLAARLCRRWTTERRCDRFALAAAAVFSVHPIHTEAVAWVAGITDLSYTVFGLLALIASVRTFDRGWSPWPGLFLLCSLLSKETGIAVLGLMLVLEASEANRNTSWSLAGAARRLALPGLATGLYLGLRLWALGSFAPSVAQHPHAALNVLASGAGLLARYLGLLFAPVEMNLMREVPLDRGFSDPAAVVGLALALGIAVAGWLLRRQAMVVFALAVVALPILPATFFPAIEGGGSVFGERYLYLPVLGLALIVALLLSRAAAGSAARRSAATLATAVIVIVGSAVSFARAGIWADSVTLWTDAAVKAPGNALAHEGLCHALYVAGRPQDAIRACDAALALDASRVDARINRAAILLVFARPAEALRELETALALSPNEPEGHTCRGLAEMMLGRAADAEASYRRALAIDPRHAEAHNDLGVLLARTGRFAEARAHFEQAVQFSPGNPEYRVNLDACPR